jgi:hypothetical protein
MYVVANDCMNEGLPEEQIIHQTRQATLAVQTALNRGRPLGTKEEKRGFMTRPNMKKVKKRSRLFVFCRKDAKFMENMND